MSSAPPRPDDFGSADADAVLKALYRVPKRPVRELRKPLTNLLNHHDPDVREETIKILVMRWKDPTVRPTAFQMLSADNASEVRQAAALAVGASSSPETASADIEALAKVLRDETEHGNVRGAAYDALLIMHRRADFPTKTRDFDPSTDVDWGWIETLPD